MSKHLLDIEEFQTKIGNTENYIPPKYVVQPAENDKIYFYMEDELYKVASLIN
jgi:hypothetical protein